MGEGPGQLSRGGIHLTVALISTAEGRHTHARELPKEGCQWHHARMEIVVRLRSLHGREWENHGRNLTEDLCSAQQLCHYSGCATTVYLNISVNISVPAFWWYSSISC